MDSIQRPAVRHVNVRWLQIVHNATTTAVIVDVSQVLQDVNAMSVCPASGIIHPKDVCHVHVTMIIRVVLVVMCSPVNVNA